MMTEQEELAKVIIEEWNTLFRNNIGKEIDKEKFKENIDFWYENYLKKSSPKIIYYDSPKELSKLDIDTMYSKRVEILNDPSEKLPNYIRQIRSISSTVYSRPVSKFPISFEENINRNLVGNRIPYSRFFIIYGAYFDYLYRLGISNTPAIKAYIELAKTPSFLIYLCEDCVFVIQPPVEVNLENNRPHSIKGPSIKFRDGTEYYHFRGIEVEKYIFKKVQDRSITLEEVLEIENEEEESSVLLMYQELYGEEGIYQFISESLREIDSYYHKTGDKTLCYTLFKGRLSRNLRVISYVRCYCPSTDRMFFLGTFPWVKNAKDAIASLYRIPRKLERHIKYINRQGERFTTVLTDKGNEIRKSLIGQDLKDLITISGDDYFRLMRYEY